MIEKLEIPNWVMVCKPYLEFQKKKDYWLITDCKCKEECYRCPMTHENPNIKIKYHPNQIINLREIRQTSKDDVCWMDNQVVLTKEFIEKNTKSLKESKDQWYYYTEMVLDLDTLFVFQISSCGTCIRKCDEQLSKSCGDQGYVLYKSIYNNQKLIGEKQNV